MSLPLAPIPLLQVNKVSGPAAGGNTQGAGGPAGAPHAIEGQADQQGGAPPAKRPPAGGGAFQLLMLVGIFVIFYFIAIRPQQKQAKEHKKLLAELSVGDPVVTQSGILGRIVKIEGKITTLEIDKNTRIRILKSHVGARQQQDEAGGSQK